MAQHRTMQASAPCAARHSLTCSFNTHSHTKGLFEFCAAHKLWFDNSQSWNNLSKEQALLPCWRHSVPTWPHPAIEKKGQFIFQAHSLFIAVWWDSSWKSQSVSGETMATVMRRPTQAHRVISHGAHLVIEVAWAEFTARILEVNSPLGPLK